MGSPHPPNHTVGAGGPAPYAESQPVEFPHEPAVDARRFAPGSSNDPARPSGPYPGQLPPSAYPQRRSKRRLFIGILLAVALVAAITVAIVYGVRTNGANTGASLSEGAAKTAIQGYLEALEHRDTDSIVRNALCGMPIPQRNGGSFLAFGPQKTAHFSLHAPCRALSAGSFPCRR